MDILMMLADLDSATGHSGSTDFLSTPDGRLTRAAGDPAGLIYAGAAIADPGIFAGAAATPHSLNAYFDRAIASGRLYGMRMEGSWITVGTPDAIPLAEDAVAKALRQRGMSSRGPESARVFSISPGAPFLPTLASALTSGALVPGFGYCRRPAGTVTAPSSTSRRAAPPALCALCLPMQETAGLQSCRRSRR